MIDFRVKDHAHRPGVKPVEVWNGDVFVATITHDILPDALHIRVTSKYMTRVTQLPTPGGPDMAVVILENVRR